MSRRAGISIVALAWTLAGAPAFAAPAAKKALQRVAPPFAVTAAEFSDGSKPVKFDAFRGRPLLINVWATWCPPCVKELPALDRLAASLAGEATVVALSTDDGGATVVRPFLDKLKVRHMTALYDPQAKSFQEFPLRGMPTTYLVAADGRVIASLEGATDWDSPEMLAQIRTLLGKR